MSRLAFGMMLCLAAASLAAQPSVIIVNGKVWTGDKRPPKCPSTRFPRREAN